MLALINEIKITYNNTLYYERKKIQLRNYKRRFKNSR